MERQPKRGAVRHIMKIRQKSEICTYTRISNNKKPIWEPPGGAHTGVRAERIGGSRLAYKTSFVPY